MTEMNDNAHHDGKIYVQVKKDYSYIVLSVLKGILWSINYSFKKIEIYLCGKCVELLS